MGGKTGSVAPLNVTLLSVTAERYTGGGKSARAEFFHEIMTGSVRKPEIAQKQIKFLHTQQGHCAAEDRVGSER